MAAVERARWRHRSPPGGLLILVALLVLDASGALAGNREAKSRPCPVSIVAVRDRRPNDHPTGSDPGSVYGPDSLRLLVDAPDGHPRVLRPRAGCRIVYRLLAWNPWQRAFLRGVEALRRSLRC
jgi:hypothetical protein